MKQKNQPLALTLALTVMLGGCQPAGAGTYLTPTSADSNYVPAYYSVNNSAGYGVPVAEPTPAATPPMPARAPEPSPHVQQALSGLEKLSDRLQRVEKAMLRLDRRMQLVERNELNRMSGNISLSPQEEQTALHDLDIGPRYADGFRPVNSTGAITSSLQAAPRDDAQGINVAVNTTQNVLPSLADVEPAAGKVADGELAVWTVQYEAEKVWPDRAQLPGSRDVVEALRAGKSVTVFARGKHPQAVAFRDRVKALSRYLSKVTSLDSVPIATIPAPHLDDDTVEIFAAY